MIEADSFIHPSSIVDERCNIGAGTKVWHFCHLMAECRIGTSCVLGQNVHVARGVKIGNRCKIQNNVSLYEGVELDDDVFCGPSMVFTNVINPRSAVNRKSEYLPTRVGLGVTIGANATLVCGASIGRHAFIAAGAVVTKDVPDYALMIGVPARQQGWMSRHGQRLMPGGDGPLVCSQSGWRYEVTPSGALTCLDWPDDKPLE